MSTLLQMIRSTADWTNEVTLRIEVKKSEHRSKINQNKKIKKDTQVHENFMKKKLSTSDLNKHKIFFFFL